MKNIFFENFATTYSCNAYGSGSYDSQTSCSTTTGGSSGGSSSLVDTGVNVILPLVLGVILIGSAIALLIVGKKKRAKNN